MTDDVPWRAIYDIDRRPHYFAKLNHRSTQLPVVEARLVLPLQTALQILHRQRNLGKIVRLQHRQIDQFVAGEGKFRDSKLRRRIVRDLPERPIAMLIKEHPIYIQPLSYLGNPRAGEAVPHT